MHCNLDQPGLQNKIQCCSIIEGGSSSPGGQYPKHQEENSSPGEVLKGSKHIQGAAIAGTSLWGQNFLEQAMWPYHARAEKQKADVLCLQPLWEVTSSTNYTLVPTLVNWYEPKSPVYNTDVRITSHQPHNWDSNPEKVLPQPSVELLKRTEASIGMLQLQ